MTIRQTTVVVLMMSAVACWGQSLGDVARASREHARQSTAKVITNEDVKSTQAAEEPAQAAADSLQGELDHMKQVFEHVCADPKTDHGSKLSDADRSEIAESVKPLRARIGSFQQIGLGYKAELEAMNKQLEADLKGADAQRTKSVRQEYESRKQSLLERAKGTMRDYEDLKKQLEAVSNACPAAAATVPN